MNYAGSVETELDASLLCLLYGPSEVLRLHHSACAGVRHQTAASQNAAQAAYPAHQVRRGDCNVEAKPAALDALHKVVVTDVIGARLSGGRGGLARGENQNAYLLAKAVGQKRYARG